MIFSSNRLWLGRRNCSGVGLRRLRRSAWLHVLCRQAVDQSDQAGRGRDRDAKGRPDAGSAALPAGTEAIGGHSDVSAFDELGRFSRGGLMPLAAWII